MYVVLGLITWLTLDNQLEDLFMMKTDSPSLCCHELPVAFQLRVRLVRFPPDPLISFSELVYTNCRKWRFHSDISVHVYNGL